LFHSNSYVEGIAIRGFPCGYYSVKILVGILMDSVEQWYIFIRATVRLGSSWSWEYCYAI